VIRRKEETVRDRRLRRLATTVLAPAAALAAWALFRLGGVEFTLKSGDTVGALDVVSTALMGAVVGWLVVRAIDRHTIRPRATWIVVATTALAVSVIGPSWFADGSSAAALIALHVVTAAVVIAGFAGTVPVRGLETPVVAA
jgi:ABC-type Co2+ transport system permease subunit